MSEHDRKVHVGNYVVPKATLLETVRSQFGPCQVKDPFQPKVSGHSPFGFIIFEKSADAQSCLAARRCTIDGETVIFSPPSTNKPRNESQTGTGNKNNQGNAGSQNFSFGGIGNSGPTNHSNSVASRFMAAGDSPTNKPETIKFKAILSHCDGISQLYVQNLSGTMAVDYLRLQAELGVHCQTAPIFLNPQPEQICAGLYSEDGAWYRCSVQKENPDGTYLVRFVDYGNNSTVKANDLRSLTQSMLSKPAAAVRCHLKDLLTRSGCETQVQELLSQSWQEVLLECEAHADHSIDLYNKETDKYLRAVLINSGYVMLESMHSQPTSKNGSSVNGAVSDTGSVESQGKKSKKQKQKNSGGGDSAMNIGNKASESAAAVTELKKSNNEMKKQLAAASKKIVELTERKNIDSLNKELHEKLAAVKTLRPKFPVATDGIWNKAITLLSEAAYTKDIHDDIFEPVITLYEKYISQQDQLRQCSELDAALIADRDKIKGLFCEAVKTCEQRCAELKASERRTKLKEALVKLSDLYPSLSVSKFEGEVEQTIADFLDWQTSMGEDIKNIQKSTEEALDSLSQQLGALQQSLVLEVNEPEEEVGYEVETATQLAISALSRELEVADMSEGKATYKVIYSLCSALQTKIGGEFTLLDEMHNKLDKLQEVSRTIEPWLGVTEPENLDWMQKKEKKLKELRSQLRHRMADLDDLNENDEEERSDTEITDMEKQVDDVRNMIHSVVVELEEYTQKLADISHDVFPEFAVQFPKLQLRAIKEGGGFVKALRDITFYKDNGNTETVFNGKRVILKTLSKPAGSFNAIPGVVTKIHSSALLKTFINVDAVFFSKNGVNTYVQLSSEHGSFIEFLRDMDILDVAPLEELAMFSVSSESASDDGTDVGDDSVDFTSTDEPNIGV